MNDLKDNLMSAYKYGQSPAEKARERLATAQVIADILAAQIIEAQNRRAQKRLEELNRQPRINPYPIDPDWYAHRQDLNRELTTRAQRNAA